MAQIKIENLTFRYPLRQSMALSGVDFTIEDGEFLVLCGKSGCGKSTLLRLLKPELSPHGQKNGGVFLGGHDIYRLEPGETARRIGFVMQNPDNQVVTDKVWFELAFGLENLGVDPAEIRLRVAEMASFFNIADWCGREVAELSGGGRQLLALAAVMVMQPEVLILDEPTSQLDPIAASEFLKTLKKINNELGTTVILTEHRLEEAIPLADRVAVMDSGRIIFSGSPGQTGEALKNMNSNMFYAMPSAMQIYSKIDADVPCPVTVRDGRRMLKSIVKKPLTYNRPAVENGGAEILKAKELWFRYEKNGDDILKSLDFSMKQGEIHAILGANGAGKSTFISVLCGFLKPYRGRVRIFGKGPSDKDFFAGAVGVLPQNPDSLFIMETVRGELEETAGADGYEKTAALLEIDQLLDYNPYDLSGGEKQRAALCKILLLKPRLLIMDEPTKGLDAGFKIKFGELLRRLKAEGISVLMVSHDVEFCAKYAERCSLFFDGRLIATAESGEFFKRNCFYTTSACRMSRGIIDGAVTEKEVAECLKNLE